MKIKDDRQFSVVILVFGLLITSCNNSSEKPATNSTNTEIKNQKQWKMTS